jgi:hypothetical protein
VFNWTQHTTLHIERELQEKVHNQGLVNAQKALFGTFPNIFLIFIILDVIYFITTYPTKL